MKQYLYICISALLLVGATPMQAQTRSKTKAKSTTQTKAKSGTTKSRTAASSSKVLYVEPEDRNYAQNLGGYMYWDYAAKESRDLLTKQLISKSEEKELLAKSTYNTYDEAFQNLLTIPSASEIDTREKLTHYIDYVFTPRMDAIKGYEPEPELKEESDRFNKLRMEIAKKARKGLPFDTIPFDKKWPQYNKVLDKVKAVITPLHKQFVLDHYTMFDVSDPDGKSWLGDHNGGSPRFIYNTYLPLLKQIVREWFGSKECKLVQGIEDELRARVAAEKPKKTPDWFVEGRKREAEIVAQYNRKIADRWIKRIPLSTMSQCKTAITKLIAYNKELEAIRGNDKLTSEYISARISCKGCIESAFYFYYELLNLYRLPLVRTPQTQEGAKKFKLEESPWKLSYPYSPRR